METEKQVWIKYFITCQLFTEVGHSDLVLGPMLAAYGG